MSCEKTASTKPMSSELSNLTLYPHRLYSTPPSRRPQFEIAFTIILHAHSSPTPLDSRTRNPGPALRHSADVRRCGLPAQASPSGRRSRLSVDEGGCRSSVTTGRHLAGTRRPGPATVPADAEGADGSAREATRGGSAGAGPFPGSPLVVCWWLGPWLFGAVTRCGRELLSDVVSGLLDLRVLVGQGLVGDPARLVVEAEMVQDIGGYPVVRRAETTRTGGEPGPDPGDHDPLDADVVEEGYSRDVWVCFPSAIGRWPAPVRYHGYKTNNPMNPEGTDRRHELYHGIDR